MGMTRTINVRSGPVGRGHEPLLCAPIIGRTRTELLPELRRVVGKRPDLIEWRVDYFSEIADGAAVLGTLQDLRQGAAGIPIIFTIRSTGEGGETVPINDQQVTALCQSVCAAHAVEIIDCELSASPESLQQVRAAATQSDTKLILSYHNFRETPDAETLYAKFSLAQELGADIAKVAVMPTNPDEVLTLLRATYRAHRALSLPLIGISMGAYGVLTRLFGWLFGSSVTFAAGEASSAPGQMTAEDLNAALQIVRRAIGSDQSV